MPFASSTTAILCVMLIALGGFPCPALGQGDLRAANERWEEIDRRPGDGEQCIVCGKRIFDEEVVELRYRGRTFHVGAPLLGDFEEDPERYFTKLRSRSALFDEAAHDAPPMATGWLWFGVYVLAGLVFGALCAYVAVGKALAPIPWFFAGLVANVLALAALAAVRRGDDSHLPAGIPRGLRKVPTTRTPATCPECGRTNHPSAVACSVCGARLDPRGDAETARI